VRQRRLRDRRSAGGQAHQGLVPRNWALSMVPMG
jgi:hypothetical protein